MARSAGTRRTFVVLGTIVWALIPALSIGLLAFLPFAHAAIKVHNRRLWLVTATYAIASVVVFGPLGAASNQSDLGASVFTAAVFGLMLIATVHAFLLRRRVFFTTPVQPAMAAALAARELREHARAIVGRDPALAHELRIGRPDLPRQFDDGGLIDVNRVPEQVLVDRLSLAPAEAARMVQARDRLGGFTSVEEISAFAEIPDAKIDMLRERLVFPPTE